MSNEELIREYEKSVFAGKQIADGLILGKAINKVLDGTVCESDTLYFIFADGSVRKADDDYLER